MTVNIEQIKRDRKEGTPGRWVHYSKGRLERIEAKINGALICICGIHKIGSRGGKEVGCWRANARRVARLPDLEATVIAQSEEIERLREALENQRLEGE